MASLCRGLDKKLVLNATLGSSLFFCLVICSLLPTLKSVWNLLFPVSMCKYCEFNWMVCRFSFLFLKSSGTMVVIVHLNLLYEVQQWSLSNNKVQWIVLSPCSALALPLVLIQLILKVNDLNCCSWKNTAKIEHFAMFLLELRKRWLPLGRNSLVSSPCGFCDMPSFFLQKSGQQSLVLFLPSHPVSSIPQNDVLCLFFSTEPSSTPGLAIIYWPVID